MNALSLQPPHLVSRARELYEETERHRIFRVKWEELNEDTRYHWCVFAKSASKPEQRARRP